MPENIAITITAQRPGVYLEAKISVSKEKALTVTSLATDVIIAV